MNARKAVVAVWGVLLTLTALTSVTSAATSSGGLFAPTVCLSPAVWAVTLVTPTEVLVEAVSDKVGLDLSDTQASNNNNNS